MSLRNLSLSFALVLCALPRVAEAQEHPANPAVPAGPPNAAAPADSLPPLVLDVTLAPGIDHERLRPAVAEKTHRDVVLSTDPRAALSPERVRVTRAAGRTRVRFEPSPREREMVSEKDAEAALRQIALLAANVVTGEADELLSELRQARRATSPNGLAADASSKTDGHHVPNEVPDMQEAREAREGELAYERLEATLRFHSESTAGTEVAVGIAAIGASLLMVPVGVYVRERLSEPVSGSFLTGLGSAFFGAGVWSIIGGLSNDPPVRDLHRLLVSQHGTQPSLSLVRGIEKEWRDRAAKSTRTLRWVGAFSLGIGALGMGVGTGTVVSAPTDASGRTQASTGAFVLGAGSVLSVIGVAMLLSRSPLERDYEAYERASKRPILTAGVAPIAGGAAFSLSGRF